MGVPTDRSRDGEVPSSACPTTEPGGGRWPPSPSASRRAPLYHPPMRIRLAEPSDVAELDALIRLSARGLSGGFYTPDEVEAAIRFVFGVDSQLIADGTYFAAVSDATIVGCGGWSKRATLYGGDQAGRRSADLLDPASDAARIRAFFVAPTHAR